MSRMPPRPDTRQSVSPRSVERLNLVATTQTRRLADRMVFAASKSTGPDAVLHHFRQIDPDQIPALIGVLLTATKAHKKLGRPRIKLAFTPEDRREAHRRYNAGERDQWVIDGQREYQRANQRELRKRKQDAR